MSFKTTYILFAVLIVMLGLFGLLVAFKKTGTDMGYVFPSLNDAKRPVKLTDMDAVTIDRAGEKRVVLVRDKQGWHSENPRLRLLDYKVNSMVQEVAGARRDEEADVNSDFTQWGLDEPRTVVTLHYTPPAGSERKSEEWILKLGRNSPEKGGVVYVTSSDRPREVLAVKRSELGSVLKFNLNDLRSTKLLEATAFVTQALTVSDLAKLGAPKFSLRRNAQGTYVFTTPSHFGPAALDGETISLAGQAPRQAPGVRGLFQAIDGLEADGFEPFGKHPLSWYGLGDDSKGLRIGVVNSKGGGFGAPRGETEKQTLLIGKQVPGKDAKNVRYYARLLAERAVVRVPSKGVKTIRDTLNQNGEILRSLKLTQLQPTSADAIDIHNPDGLTQLRRDREMHWQVYNPLLKQTRRADDGKVQALLGALNASQQIRRFLDHGSDKEFGVATPKTSIEVWVDAVAPERKPAAKKTKTSAKSEPPGPPPLKKGVKSAVQLFFGATLADKTLVYVKRILDGQTNQVVVPVALLNRVNEGPLTYLDRNLTGFTAPNVTDLVRTRGTETYEIARDPKENQWKLLRPKASGQRRADQANALLLVQTLTRLHVVRWVKILDAKPSPADLKPFGLDNPTLKVEVTFKSPATQKKETREFVFGKMVQFDKDGNVLPGGQSRGEKNPQPGVYGRVGSDVFLTRAREYRDLTDIELRDRTVFQFDPSAVTRLQLNGWHDSHKKDFLIEFEVVRRQDEWDVKEAPKGFEADPAQVFPLLRVLATLKLTRFVKPSAKEDYGFGKDKNGKDNSTLTFRITLKGKKEPHTLILGRPQSKDFYYAKSDTLGDAVFLLPASQFAMLLKDKGSWIDFFQMKGK
jgi:hypothetical protein